MADPRRIAERSFSTLPRVELPGALLLQFKTPEIIQLSVPYLGSNCLEQRRRGIQSRFYVACFQYPTSGRTAWSCGRVTIRRHLRVLSVPYLGSNCLELPASHLYVFLATPFSTLPRVELPGADRACSYPVLPLTLSVPYLGSNCLEPTDRACSYPVLPLSLSVPYLGSNCLEQ